MRIFVDFEATEAGEIIAIGAVADNDARYFGLAKPQFTPLTERITALTGLTDETLSTASPFWMVVRDFVSWCNTQAAGNGYCLLAFGKNDRVFAATTLDLYKSHGYDSEYLIKPLEFLAHNITNGADPIYKAFNRPLVSLRSAYLTYLNDTHDRTHSHNPVEDAIMFRDLIVAVENGWKLPVGASMVKVVKPVLPKKAPREDFCTPDELHRTVVCYWRRGNQDKSAVYRDLVSAAKALCQKALNAGVSPEQAAYRILQAAIEGGAYCDRKFFLVD